MALFTYDDTSRREDLLSILRDVSPTFDNYLVSNLATSEATNTLHQWVTYNIARPTTVTFQAEGFDASDASLTAPSRSQNITSVIARVVRVSGTERAVNAAIPGDPMDFQKQKQLMALRADMEWALVNGGGLVSGSSGTARQFAGLMNVLSTNVTARNSGTSMSTTELEDMLQDCWTQVASGYTPNVILCPLGIKRKIAGFTSRITHYADSTTDIFANVDVYHASSSDVKIIPHKDVANGSGTTHVYALNDNMFKIAFLKSREPHWEDLSTTGDAQRGMYITEMTLESLAEKTSAKRYGYALQG